MTKKQNEIILELRSASLDIPLFHSANRTLKSSFINSLTGGKFKKIKNITYINALNNLNIKFLEGERVGLIGHNGAGKTTFLRLISGIYSLSKGTIKRRTKIYPMIHKSLLTSEELSGIKAMKAHYLLINQNLKGFEDFCGKVVNFSGLGEYIYLPLKTYSQGMLSRLQFAILTGCSHECLALDEGFATGDIDFQKKAYNRLTEFISNSGTLFLASHSNELLLRFCKRGLVFEKGTIAFDGPIEKALNFYEEKI